MPGTIFPDSVRGAVRVVKRAPLAIGFPPAVGDATIRGGTGLTVPQCPSAPAWTHVAAGAERTKSGFVACRRRSAAWLAVISAEPSAPVVAAALAPLTVAPATGVEVPSPLSRATCTLNGVPAFAVAGAPSTSGSGLTQPAPKQSGNSSTLSPLASSVSQSPAEAYLPLIQNAQ